MTRIHTKTPRQWLIAFAADKLRTMIDPPADRLQAARLAAECVIAGQKDGTLGGAMRDYYLNATETARERLDVAISRKAKRWIP